MQNNKKIILLSFLCGICFAYLIFKIYNLQIQNNKQILNINKDNLNNNVINEYENIVDNEIETTSLNNTENLPNLNNIDNLLNDFYNAKAEKEAYDIEKDILKQNKELNKISKNDYEKQKDFLEKQKDLFNLEKEKLWKDLTNLGYNLETLYTYDFNSKDEKTIKNDLENLKNKENEIENEIELLKSTYFNNNCSREDFIETYSKLEREKDLIYAQLKPIIDYISTQDKEFWINAKFKN